MAVLHVSLSPKGVTPARSQNIYVENLQGITSQTRISGMTKLNSEQQSMAETNEEIEIAVNP
jgi:hypothetical protein